MKVLFIIDIIDNGGVGIVLKNLVNHLDKKKYHVDILTFEECKRYENEFSDDVHIKHAYKKNPAKSKSRIKRYLYATGREYVPKWYIRKKFKINEYDLAIDFKGNNLNVLTSAGCKKVYWCHKDFSTVTNLVEKERLSNYGKTFKGRYKDRLFRKRINMVDNVVCISEYTKEAFVKRFQYKKRVDVVHNVIDSENIIRKSLEEIEYKKDNSLLTFCCMSRISKGKGIERLLDCVQRLNEMGYKYQINIVGGGDGLANVLSEFSRMNLDNVTFWGNQDNPYPYLRESDIFVCPSETEAYCTVLCEAIVLGKPIIMTDVGASREIMSKGSFGYIVENSPSGILNAMKKFLDEPELIKKYTRECIIESSPFEVNASIEEVEAFFSEMD